MKNFCIAILTTFYYYDQAYSLISVVEDQLRMLVDNGYKIKLIVDRQFTSPGGYWSHPNVKLERISGFTRSNEGILPDNYQEEVDKLYVELKEILNGCKVCISHDITLQPASLPLNLACRKLASERSDLKFMHLSHSATAPEVRCSNAQAREIIQRPFPGNAIMLYPNEWDRHRVALNYKYEEDKVKCVYHCSDFLSLLFGDGVELDNVPNLSEEAKKYIDRKVNYPINLSKDFCREFDVLNADVISCIPARLDRGKQVEWNIKIMGAIKKTGRSVKLIVIDFHSNSKDPNDDKFKYREELKKIAKEWGLELNKDLIFTSEWREDTNLHVPRQFVMNIKKIGDLCIHLSTSETYSLVVQESIATKNLVVLNHHTPYMREIYGSKNVIHIPAGGAVNCLDQEDGATNLDISDPKLHFDNLAKKILYYLENNHVLNEWRIIRQTRNPDYIFKNQLEPLFYE